MPRFALLSQNRSISVPYPTSFHLSTTGALAAHRQWANASSRPSLAVMYAGAHGAGPDGSGLRNSLLKECNSSDSCVHLEFDASGVHKFSNAEVHAALRDATFCLEPQGDTPFRSQVFECLISGSIPVFFTSCPGLDMVYERLYEPFLPRFDRTEFGLGTWAVVLDSRRAENEEGYTMAALARIARDADAIRKVQRTILSLMPRLMYPEPNYVSSDCHAKGKWETLGVQEPNALVILQEVLTSRGLPNISDCRKNPLSSDVWPLSRGFEATSSAPVPLPVGDPEPRGGSSD